MDPVPVFGLVASIIQLDEATAKVIKYVNEVKDAPKELASFSLQAASLMQLLMTLKQHIEDLSVDDTSSFSSIHTLGVPGGPISQLQADMELFWTRLKYTRKKLARGLFRSSFQKDCVAVLSKIERFQGCIRSLLQDDAFRMFLMVKKDVDSIAQSQMISHIEDDQKILEWLSRRTYVERHNDVFQKRTSGTGDWLLRTKEFQSFLSTDKRVLWCYGIRMVSKFEIRSI